MQTSFKNTNIIYRSAQPVLFGVRLATRWNRYDIQQNSKWIKTELINMGPAYIKMGQLVASRSDLFPKEMVCELSSLHDDVPPCAFTDVRRIVERELNGSLEDLFIDFSPQSVSSASIGQIHIATLKKWPDTPLAIKVQRPNISDEFKQDMDSIVLFTWIAKTIMPHKKEMTDLYNVLSQSRRFIENELDFCKERDNLLSMRHAFKDDPHILIPRVVKSISTERILAMEYIASSKFENTNDVNRVTRRLVKSMVNGALRHGLLHGDLHPGNIGMSLRDDRIVLYDFGLVLDIDPNVVKTLTNCVLTSNIDMLFEVLVSNNLVYVDDPVLGTIQLKRMIKYVIDYILSLDIDRFIQNLSNDVTLNSEKLCFHVDSKLFLMSRTMALLEGTCTSIDKSFVYTDVIMDMLMDEQSMEYVDMEVVFTRGLSDLQNMLLKPSTSADDKSSDDLLYFSTKYNSSSTSGSVILRQSMVIWLTFLTVLQCVVF
jgi:ubiquinone biosynthesis protein